jgi:hypothetical protein
VRNPSSELHVLALIEIENAGAVMQFMKMRRSVPAQPEVYSQFPVDAKIVLDVGSEDIGAGAEVIGVDGVIETGRQAEKKAGVGETAAAETALVGKGVREVERAAVGIGLVVVGTDVANLATELDGVAAANDRCLIHERSRALQFLPESRPLRPAH